MQSHRLGHAVHGEIANDVAAVFTGPFHTSTLKCDLGKFCGIEKFGAKQMMIAFLNFGIDAGNGNPGDNGRTFRMLAVYFDRSTETKKVATHGADKLMQ